MPGRTLGLERPGAAVGESDRPESAGYERSPSLSGWVRMTESTEPPVTVAGRYRIESRIGIGGQAAVYQVFDERLRVHRAIKVLLPEYARRTPLRDRFISEAQSMAHLDHPHIIRVFDVVLDSDLPFIVMELVPGGSLAQWVERHGPMPPRLAVKCILQTAAALGAAHTAGVVHRDVKPHNVLVDAKGLCRLGDFGIARAEATELRTLVGSRMGTEGYMAPEQQVDASSVDERADIYGLGVSLWVLLEGRDPVELFHSSSLDGVPEALRPVVNKAIENDPSKRYASVRSFALHLEAVGSELADDPEAAPLVGALPAEMDGYQEISLITRQDTAPPPVTTDSAAPALRPPFLGYVMPDHAELTRVEGEPDYVAQESRRAPPMNTYVGRSYSQPSQPALLDPLPPRRGGLRGLVRGVRRWLDAFNTQFVGVAAPLLGIVLVVLAACHGVMAVSGYAVTRASGVLDEALHEEQAVVEALTALGADGYRFASPARCGARRPRRRAIARSDGVRRSARGRSPSGRGAGVRGVGSGAALAGAHPERAQPGARRGPAVPRARALRGAVRLCPPAAPGARGTAPPSARLRVRQRLVSQGIRKYTARRSPVRSPMPAAMAIAKPTTQCTAEIRGPRRGRRAG